MDKQQKTDESFKQKQQELLEAKKSFFKESQAEKGKIEELRAQTLDALRAQQAQGLAAALGGSSAGTGARLVAGQQAAQSGAMTRANIENQFLAQQSAAREKALKAHTGFLEFGAKLDMESNKKIQDYGVALQTLANNSRGFFGFNQEEFDAQVARIIANETDPAVKRRIQEMAASMGSGSGTAARFFGLG